MRRTILTLTAGLLALLSAVPVAFAAPASLVVLDYELDGDVGDASLNAEHEARMKRLAELLRQQLQQSGLYRVVDNGPAEDLINELQARQYLHRCNGCEMDIARRLGADYVLVPWVSRMSHLVLTMHVEIKQVTTGRRVMKRALDFRGDNDRGWSRAVDFLIRDMKEGKMSNL